MATIKQIQLSLKRTNDKIVKFTKEIACLKECKIKLTNDLKKEKESSPKKGKKK